MTLPELWFTTGVILLCIAAGIWAFQDAGKIDAEHGKTLSFWVNWTTGLGVGVLAPAYIVAFLVTLYA